LIRPGKLAGRSGNGWSVTALDAYQGMAVHLSRQREPPRCPERANNRLAGVPRRSRCDEALSDGAGNRRGAVVDVQLPQDFARGAHEYLVRKHGLELARRPQEELIEMPYLKRGCGRPEKAFAVELAEIDEVLHIGWMQRSSNASVPFLSSLFLGRQAPVGALHEAL
jgi:hypothetical protein